MKEEIKKSLNFIGDKGQFTLNNPHLFSYLYFPLVNEGGMISSITPTLHGDAKYGHNSFLMAPVSSEDLHNSRASRNFWIYIKGVGPWSVSGNSASQISCQYDKEDNEDVSLEAGLLWHKVTRINKSIGVKAEITNFLPANKDKVELMKITIENVGDKNLYITPTSAIPIYGRSADNLRDHRHVTSLLHRINTVTYGVTVKPTLSFDERGHNANELTYCVMGAGESGEAPIGFLPDVEEFIGEGGNLEWPEAVIKNTDRYFKAESKVDGCEAIGGLRFSDINLKPNEQKSYVFALGIAEKDSDIQSFIDYCRIPKKFEDHLLENKRYWEQQIHKLSFKTGDETFNQWMKWVTIQPILRRICGCSFLPHHDYGKGGRGWRDLWQDCLALLAFDPSEVKNLLFSNYAGVRFDGSNATIIGSEPGEFVADRNQIPRVWMDHGVWPFLTTKLYIDQSGDFNLLLEEQVYFKDNHIDRCKGNDNLWTESQGSQLLDEKGNKYKGSILEHIVVQHLTSFFNVGIHNIIKIEGADWNDGLDMAEEKGESVAFTALYGSNLLELAELIRNMQNKHGIKEIEVASEIMILLDSLTKGIDYNSIEEKNNLLNKYFSLCQHRISGSKVTLSLEKLAQDFERKGKWIIEHIREHELINNKEGHQWFNGYYDNDGVQLEGDNELGVRMTLTGQVFTLMGGIAFNEQSHGIIESCKKYLKDSKVGGYRLNTNFNEVKLNMGRSFGFAYGHKENGAMFSHMSIMYANALYKQGFIREGFDVIDSIYKHCKEFSKSKIYPGVPEYINEKGRGMYQYLTGSASWLILTLLTEVYGVRGHLGDLMLEPKLVIEQFDDNNEAGIYTFFGGRRIYVRYRNSNRLQFNKYKIKGAFLNGDKLEINKDCKYIIIKREKIELLETGKTQEIIVELL